MYMYMNAIYSFICVWKHLEINVSKFICIYCVYRNLYITKYIYIYCVYRKLATQYIQYYVASFLYTPRLDTYTKQTA